MATRIIRRMERLSTISRVPPRSRAQVASELTRLEFDRERVVRELGLIEARRQAADLQFARIEARIGKLIRIFDESEPVKPNGAR
jgi:hypothetical protein